MVQSEGFMRRLDIFFGRPGKKQMEFRRLEIDWNSRVSGAQTRGHQSALRKNFCRAKGRKYKKPLYRQFGFYYLT